MVHEVDCPSLDTLTRLAAPPRGNCIRPDLSELKWTTHAKVRKQQRGILTGAMEAVLAFGDVYWAGDGCAAYFRSKQAARRNGQWLRRVFDRARNVAVIVSADRAVVSVQHVPRPKRRWRLRHF